jgi:hypothetical protein
MRRRSEIGDTAEACATQLLPTALAELMTLSTDLAGARMARNAV